VEFYFGGAIHSHYIENGWSLAVPVCTVTSAIEGRLFARKEYVERYEKFMDCVALLTDRIPWVFEIPTSEFKKALETSLQLHVNETMYNAFDENIVIVNSYGELESILSNSPLIYAGKTKRLWVKHSSATLSQVADATIEQFGTASTGDRHATSFESRTKH
jgi:hypothetical protein